MVRPKRGKRAAARRGVRRPSKKRPPNKKKGRTGLPGYKPTAAFSERMDKFVAEYWANGMNASKAAIAIGHAKTTAHYSGYVLLKEPYVQDKLDALRRKQRRKYDITHDSIVHELATIANAKMGDVVRTRILGRDRKSGATILVTEIRPEALEDDDLSGAISEVSVDPN